MVVYGQDKLDEISLSAPTTICEIKTAGLNPPLSPPRTSVCSAAEKKISRGGTPKENAGITRSILRGEKGPKRDAVLMNAGASLYIGGKAGSMKDGIILAAQLIDSGKAAETLNRLITVSNRPEEEI